MEILSHEEGRCRGWYGGGAAVESQGTGSETREVKVPVGHPGGEDADGREMRAGTTQRN